MTRFIIAITMIIAAVFIFFGPTRGAMAGADPLKVERDDLLEARENVKQIQAKREALASQYNSFRSPDLDKLQKMLPRHVDNVRLAIDIDNMASNVGMALKNIDIRAVDTDGSSSETTRTNSDGSVLSNLDFRFTVSGSYGSLKILLSDLARSVRIVDVTELSFSSADQDLFDFDIGLRTYWLTDNAL